MWNIFSRIFLFAYDMLYRTSRRFLLFWSNSTTRSITKGTAAMDSDDTSNLKKANLLLNLDSNSGESGICTTSAQSHLIQSQFPVVKDVVINIEETEPDVKKYPGCSVTTYQTQDQVEQQEVIKLPEQGVVNLCAAIAEIPIVECISAAGDEQGTTNSTAKRIKLNEKAADSSLPINKPNPDDKKREKRKKKAKAPAPAAADNNEKGDSRPNYFVAIQVSDSTVKSKVQEIQEGMLKKEITSEIVKKKAQSGAVFKDTFVPVAKLHFTLHVFHSPDKDHLLKAQEIVEEVHSEIKHELESNPILFTIEGLGHFRNSVLFAKIKEPHHILRLEDLSTMLRNRFESASIFGDTKVFQPHMTIAKMSRSKKLHKLKIRSFPTELWSDYELEVLGTQRIEALQLLSMTESDPASGYYRCVAHLPFS